MNSLKKSLLIALFGLVITVASSHSFAHAEKDKARYVAPMGIDQGLCDNPLRPCKTILYGVSRAAKGDKLLLATGDYKLESLEEILALKGSLVPVFGGYNRFDHYSNQSPATNITRLHGVPSDMISLVRQKGFSVISDGKSKFSQQHISKANQDYVAANKSHSSTVCTDGKAANFSCKNIDLVSHVALSDFGFKPSAGNDIWGHVDLNTNKEYAIMGIVNGVAVFDLSNPESPKEVGAISGLNSSWRDIKVYQYFDKTMGVWQAYAYATIDNKSDFVTIIDLNQLPNSVSLVTKDTAVAQAHNVYISNVDYTFNIPLKGAKPTLQLVGASGNTVATKSFISYSLDNPKKLTPLALGNNQSNGYTHDGTSLRIGDQARIDECQNKTITCEIFIDFNEKEFFIWDATTPGQETKLSQVNYNDVLPEHMYVHSGWWSEDKRYVFVHDEFDEYRGGLNTTLRIFDLQSLKNPTLAGVWTGPTRAIDHNGFVRGNRYYMSNYRRGLTILDITTPASPKEVGFFDTFSASDSDGFDGAWGVYPFLPSGLILVSDINGGLFVLRDKTNTTTQGTLSFSQSQLQTPANETVTVNVNRTGGSNGTTSVAWELLPGNAHPEEDYTDQQGILHWADNDTTPKTIELTIAENQDPNEAKEKFFVRLYNPTSGATLSSPHYLTINIEGKKVAGTIGFDKNTLDINEQIGTTTITVFRNGGSDGELSVRYAATPDTATSNNDYQVTPGTLTWANGDNAPKSISVTINNDDNTEQDERFVLALSAIGDTVLATNSQLTITIKDDDNNAPPIVNIKENFEVNTSQTVQLTSSATDANNDTLSYTWSQMSGPTVTLVNADMKDASFVAPNSATTLTFKVKVTDSRGAASEKEVTVTVKAVAIPQPQPAASSSSGGNINVFLLSLLIVLVMRCYTLRNS